MATYASVDDVRLRYEAPIPEAQIEFVEQKLNDAEMILASRIGDIAAQITAATISVTAVRFVLCNMVMRVLRNPQGMRTQMAGPFSYTADREIAAGRLYVSREDFRLLGRHASAASVPLADPALEHVIQHYPHRSPWLRRSPTGVPYL